MLKDQKAGKERQIILHIFFSYEFIANDIRRR